MKELSGKTVFITDGTSGIGLGMAHAFGREGMNVMIGDIREGALASAVEALRSKQIKAEGVRVDVTQRESMREAALKTISVFEKVHVVCNNAGVPAITPLRSPPKRDRDLSIDVNLYGVIHGAEVFVPLIESHGEGGHIVNTVSAAGTIVVTGHKADTTTKFAVAAISESWNKQLAPRRIGVSVLCPTRLTTKTLGNERSDCAAYGLDSTVLGNGQEASTLRAIIKAGLAPKAVGGRVVEAVKGDELYIFIHAGKFQYVMEERFEQIRAAFSKAESNPTLIDLPPRVLPLDAALV